LKKLTLKNRRTEEGGGKADDTKSSKTDVIRKKKGAEGISSDDKVTKVSNLFNHGRRAEGELCRSENLRMTENPLLRSQKSPRKRHRIPPSECFVFLRFWTLKTLFFQIGL